MDFVYVCIERLLSFDWCDLSDGFEQAAVVKAVDPLGVAGICPLPGRRLQSNLQWAVELRLRKVGRKDAIGSRYKVNAEAFFRISLACRSCQFSRSSALIRKEL